MNILEQQCCALVDSRQCKIISRWSIPTYLQYDAVVGGEKQKSRTVFLCQQHQSKHWRLEALKDRLALIHKGFLGAWNKYGYGNVVTTKRHINWDTIKLLYCPKYWSMEH